METYKKLEKLAYGGVAFLVAFTGLCIAGALGRGGLTLRALAFFGGAGILVSALSAFHAKMRLLAEREEAERTDVGDDEGLFEESGVNSRVRQRNLQQFEGWMIPTVVGVIGVFELVSATFLFKTANSVVPISETSITTVAGCAAVAAVAAYLFGSYLVGISASGPQRVLRAVAGELAGLAWLSVATGVAFLLTLTKVAVNFDLGFGRIFATLLLLRAIERAFAVVMEIYRPRKKVDPTRAMLYESRVNGIVADPKGLLAGISEALHYQFGIRTDEAGLLKMVTVGLPIVIVCNVAVLLLFSSAVVVNPGELAVLERWGKPHANRPVLEPGMHIKLPWPIDRVYRRNVRKTRTVNVQEPGTSDRGLWNSSDAATIDLYLTPTDDAQVSKGALNSLAVELFVEYRIGDVITYLYSSLDPETALKALARRELTHKLGGATFFDSFLVTRAALAKEMRNSLQRAVDENGLGMTIVSVGLRYVQPPSQVVDSFRDVVAKGEQGLGHVLDAKRDALNQLTDKKTAAAGWVSEAQAYNDQRVGLARAEAASFKRLQPLHETYGNLLKSRIYFNALSALTNRRKIILATDIERQVIRLDLKKSKSELFEFTEENSP